MHHPHLRVLSECDSILETTLSHERNHSDGNIPHLSSRWKMQYACNPPFLVFFCEFESLIRIWPSLVGTHFCKDEPHLYFAVMQQYLNHPDRELHSIVSLSMLLESFQWRCPSRVTSYKSRPCDLGTHKA